MRNQIQNIHICAIIWKFRSPSNFREMGGAEKQLLKLLKLIQKESNINVTILTRQIQSDKKHELVSNNIEIHRINTTNISFLSMFLFMFFLPFIIIKINSRKKINLFYLPLPDIYLFSLVFIRKIMHIPIITRVAGDELNPYRKSGFWYINRILVRKLMICFDAIQVLNPNAYREALNLSYPKEKLFLIPNGVEIPKFTKSYDHLTYNLLYVGALRFYPRKNKYEQKNLKYLIDSFLQVIDEIPNLKLILVGEGNYRKTLEEYVKEKNIEKNVSFTGYQTNIYPYLLDSDIFINPSRFEGMPNTVIEAMSVGTFVICSDIPEHKFILKNHTYGNLFQLDNKSALAKEILKFYRYPEKHIAKAQKGREFVIEKFSIESSFKKFIHMILFTINNS